ncbi:putative membrane protein [Pseudoduganella flava]|uniref:Putative membrane protein n=1 Tax=Pseudoduganella flava TaxID=871742 RepID=A0A562PKC5_9BURK|nr:DUF5668 domain-containing protein [Pseudoduganella flava]QGZ42283.1 hypothetical protein GO485_26740 [Pseudoduganella flava]TWI44828.1 putative membrane protein [Pseudoduganella flava]
MSTRRQHSPAAQVVVGVAVIAIGLMFLLDNLGWLDFDMSAQFWPVILIVAGILKIMQSRSTNATIVGGLLLLFGSVLLLRGFGLFHIGWNVLAPLAMIAAGVLVVFRSTARGSRMMGAENLKVDANAEDVVYATAVLGAYKRRIASQCFAGGEVTAIMGGCELDLREASIEGDAVLHVFALMGGIDIKVPVDWTVVLEGVPMLGGFEETTLRPKDGSKRLIVRGHAIMGGLEISN